MVSTEHLLGRAAAAIILIAIPGTPSVIFVIGRALAYGRGVLATVARNHFGLFLVAAAVALGLGLGVAATGDH